MISHDFMFFCAASTAEVKSVLMGTPNREPREYSRHVIENQYPGRYIPIIFLLHCWGSLFGVPSKVPLEVGEPLHLRVTQAVSYRYCRDKK